MPTLCNTSITSLPLFAPPLSVPSCALPFSENSLQPTFPTTRILCNISNHSLCPPTPTTLTSGSYHLYAKITLKFNQLKFNLKYRASWIKDHYQYPDNSLLLSRNAVKMPKLYLPFLAIWSWPTCILPDHNTMTHTHPIHTICFIQVFA